MATQTGSFTSYWNTFCKQCKELIWGVDQNFEFSEGLLQTLYYETDIGSIPRGNPVDTSASKPKYLESDIWDCPIQGCYWCSNSKLDLFGICCSKECLFYFHDWCIERIDFFTNRRFCRFPGCDKSSDKNTLYCDVTHETEFGKVFPKWVDQHSLSKSVLRDGPNWYECKQPSNSCPKSGHSHKLSQRNSSVASPGSQTQTYAKVVSSTPKNQNSKKENDQDSKKALPGTTTGSVSNGKSSSGTKNDVIIKNNPLKPSQNDKSPGKNKQECPYMDFPSEFKNLLIFETDIGVIPREKPTRIQLTSPYSSCPNWKRETNGCYLCGNKSTTDTGNDYFNTFRCYLMFYEWCRRKIKFYTGTDLCRLPGCVRTAYVGYECCNKEHAIALEKMYICRKVKKSDLEKKMEQGPNWYKEKDCIKVLSKQSSIEDKNSQSDATNQNSKIDKSTQPNPDHNSEGINRAEATPSQQETLTPPHPPNIVFAWELTHFLYHYTDIGPIPREIFPLMPPLPNFPSPNWNAEIPQCYWCCAHPKQNGALTCSNQCSFLLNEWVHRKYAKLSNKRLCRYLGCDLDSARNSECCNRDHSSRYNFYRQFHPMLKSTEFAVGPKWYHDSDTTLIDFYERDEPFFELTNFYQCKQLFINNILWPTSEHAFQANKFVGTPLMLHVSRLNTPRDAFKFARLPKFRSWIRPDWHSVKVLVMLNILRYKFIQDPQLADLLNRTGDIFIYEHTSNDLFWGDGGDRTGANKLGELLMRVRSELRVSNPFFPTQLNHFPIVPTSVPLPLPTNTQVHQFGQLISRSVPVPISTQQPAAVNAGANHLFAPPVSTPHENPTPTIPFFPNSSTNPEISSNGTKPSINTNYSSIPTNSSFKMELKMGVGSNETIIEPNQAYSGTDLKAHHRSQSQASVDIECQFTPNSEPIQTYTSFTLPGIPSTNPFPSSISTKTTSGDTELNTGIFVEKNTEVQINLSDNPDLINLFSNISSSYNKPPEAPEPCEEYEKVRSKSDFISPTFTQVSLNGQKNDSLCVVNTNTESSALSYDADRKFLANSPDLITFFLQDHLDTIFNNRSNDFIVDKTNQVNDLMLFTDISSEMCQYQLKGDMFGLNLGTIDTTQKTDIPILDIAVPPKTNANRTETSLISFEDNSFNLPEFPSQASPNIFQTDQPPIASETNPAAKNPQDVPLPLDDSDEYL